MYSLVTHDACTHESLAPRLLDMQIQHIYSQMPLHRSIPSASRCNSELALVPRVEAFAVELAVLAASLPRLHALEITFFPPGIAEAIRDVIDQQQQQLKQVG